MPRTHRIDAPDCNDAGGCLTSTPQGSVYANDRLIAVNGAQGTSHDPCPAPSPPHCAGNWSTANGGPTVFAENIPVNSAGDVDTCGHVRVAGSNTSANIPHPSGDGSVFTDGGGGGAVYDNSEPAPGAEVVLLGDGSQYVPTTQQVYIQEENDDPVELGPAPSAEQRDVTELEADETQPPPDVPPSQDCSTVDSLPSNFVYTSQNPDFDTWAASFALSPNYTVYDLTVGPAVSTYRFSGSVNQASGLSQKQILQNLCFLAKTILEPLRAAYGDFTITSGWRNKSGNSQHNKGQAADFQIFSFHGRSDTGQLYYNRAQEIRDGYNYDQMILEWFGRNPWIHVSTNSGGHRKSVLTQTGSTSYSPGLRRLG